MQDSEEKTDPKRNPLYGTLKVHLMYVCPRRLTPFFIVSYYIKWVKTSWTDSTKKVH